MMVALPSEKEGDNRGRGQFEVAQPKKLGIFHDCNGCRQAKLPFLPKKGRRCIT